MKNLQMRVFYLLILFPLSLLGQPKGWQELTISEGLSQGMIFGLKQDQKGFIWVATKDGLNRYDGHTFTVFSHDPYNRFSLSDNSCSSLFIDSRQRLWVGTVDGGLNLFDDKTQRFYHIDVSDQLAPGAGNYEIWLVTEDPQGNIWVGTDKNKVFRVQLPISLQTQFPTKANVTDQVRITPVAYPEIRLKDKNLPSQISFHPNGVAYLGTSSGIYSFNWQKPATATRYSLFTNELVDIHSVYEDPHLGYWFATNSGQIVGSYQGLKKTITLPRKDYFGVQLKPIDAKTVAVATSDLLWIMSPAELFRQDSLTVRNAAVQLPPNVYSITNLLKDKTGNIWVGTSGYGLRKFNPSIKQFRHDLPNTSLASLYVDRQGRIYARYQYAYGLFDKATNRLVPFLNDKLPAADKRQRHLIQSRRGNFWVSNVNFQTHDQYLINFSPEWQLVKKYPLPANTAFGFYGNQTHEDSDGTLWIGATNGQLLRFDPDKEIFTVFSYQVLLPSSGAEIETYALYQDGQGTLWIGTQKGLVRVDNRKTTPTFSIYKNSESDRLSLSNDFVLSIIDDPHQPDRYLWLATKGGGLERLDKKTGLFTHVTEAQGLPNKVVYGILVDEFKKLWLSTNRGLAQFDPKTFAFRNFTKADGLQDDEFNTSSFSKSASGELLFGGVNGLTTFRASNVSGRAVSAPLVSIVGLKVNNKAVTAGDETGILAQTIDYTDQLELTHSQNLLTIEFAVMDFTNSAKNRFRFRMEGIDNDWVEAGTNRFANYAQLPDGRYTFQVMGSADGQTWSEPVNLRIRIYPPLYRSWWAYVLYGSILSFLGWQFYRFKTQRLLLQQRLLFEQQEANRLAELDTLKTRFFTTISHEFRTPLTLILGPLSDLRHRFRLEPTVTLTEPTLDLMERNSNRLLSLINQLLDLSKLEAGQLKAEPERGDMAAFFRTLASSFDLLAENSRIRFTFTQTTPEYWTDFDRDKIEKIVTNLLANAFKFTPADNDVRMTVTYPPAEKPGTLQLTVEDSGIGIDAENLTYIFERFYQVDGQLNRLHEGTGIGLALVNELVNVLGGTISVVSTKGVGSRFTVQLPVMPSVTEPTAEPIADWQTNTTAADPFLSDYSAAATQLPTSNTATDDRLLIIDDNADIRAYVRHIFADDYQIMEAEDGQEGLDMATATLPSLVICDLMMPRLDGFAFCRLLKTQEATSHIPVVMLTAKTTVEDRIQGLELGADDYLTKPFNQAEIQARVRNLIQQRQSLYQWFTTHLPVPPDTTLVPPAPLTAEQRFIDRLTGIVVQHLDDTSFSVEALAEAANLSRMQLHRKIKALTNAGATSFIRTIRLTKAAELLLEGDHSVTQVAYAVGFDNLSYFAKVFQEQYGVLPSQYGKAFS
ncbi:hybrid sensor histidine kinase/response regulator transcription factor [Fibrella aquatica]|uniref:hybrid sensor histidine kinase/response regulator transcription factor n=1 Tax=Fibrella aquatica TaxID=3242487 RepID=UPI003520EFDE